MPPVREPQGISSSSSELLLPDAPGSAPSVETRAATPPPAASHTQEIIDPGQEAPVLNTGDKVLLGLKSSFSPYAAIGWLSSAGYEQMTNTSPNYGTDRGAFGQRLGAAAIRAITEDAFSESVFAPILHEDPRYYRMGNSHNLAVRVLYAGTRPLINRTDKGNNSVNFALLAGNFAGSELTYAYYPQSNRSQREILETFGGSIGGSALGYVVDELLGSFGHILHVEK
jgi:hypothetical protein